MKHVLPRFASPVKPFGPSNTGPLLPNQLSLSVENPILQREPNGMFRLDSASLRKRRRKTSTGAVHDHHQH